MKEPSHILLILGRNLESIWIMWPLCLTLSIAPLFPIAVFPDWLSPWTCWLALPLSLNLLIGSSPLPGLADWLAPSPWTCWLACPLSLDLLIGSPPLPGLSDWLFPSPWTCWLALPLSLDLLIGSPPLPGLADWLSPWTCSRIGYLHLVLNCFECLTLYLQKAAHITLNQRAPWWSCHKCNRKTIEYILIGTCSWAISYLWISLQQSWLQQ